MPKYRIGDRLTNDHAPGYIAIIEDIAVGKAYYFFHWVDVSGRCGIENHNYHAVVDVDYGGQWHPFNTLEIFVRNKLETLGIKI